MAANTKKVQRQTSASKKKPDGVSPSAPSREATKPVHPIDSAVDKFFDHDERVRTAMSRNLKKRDAHLTKTSTRVSAAFENFSPSKYSVQERARRNFVSAGASPATATRDVVEKGVDVFRASAQRRAMKIHLGSNFDNYIDRSQEGSSSGKVSLAELMTYVQTRMDGGVLTAGPDVAFTECQAELEAQRRLNQILGNGNKEVPAPDVAAKTIGVDDPEPQETGDFVREKVRAQMETATSPEQQLHFSVPLRQGPTQTDKAVETFELRAGPADVTSYHDFNSLQIAFEHVWQEIFDGRLAKLGQDLYHEYVKLQEFVGRDPKDKTIDTIDDLRNLMDEIRELGRLTNGATPVQLQPRDDAGGANAAGDTADTVVGVVSAVLDPVGAIADAIGNETVEAIINPLGGIIKAIAGLIVGYPKLTWASLPGREPGGNGDMITVRVEPNAVAPGTVEIQLSAGQGVGWKGMNFIRLDEQLRPMSPMGIVTANRDDPMVWNKDSYNRLPLYTSEVERAYLQFWHESGIIHTVCFVMDGLTEKIKDGTRVTFAFTKR